MRLDHCFLDQGEYVGTAKVCIRCSTFYQGGTASSILSDANWRHNTTVSSCEDFHAKTCSVECVARGRV
ncbi:hypothetical protein APHMUC_0277 [Anaplasma phagocytophilum str. ApMUC09]|uniref:Uncharacterized protein n=1 Tax=Anaplasma phagocytophilum str. ApMUC09 TaxID=1359152 RepID=A0A0F3N7L8_ANAPH|nr:hypothetical protein APHMUC_0277 [Anaplasma phagocytophilum str. ApMUC09]SCV64786.1 hypothetical protein ANAPH2_01067 [Anaplasma phagocytophilum]